jgi:putative membrane protein
MARWLVASVHLLGFGMALGASFARAAVLRGALDRAAVRRVLLADNAWGVSALLLIGTGVLRAFAGLEKGSEYYLNDPVFQAKLALVALVLLLEVWPMSGLIRWRIQLGRGQPIATEHARAWGWISAAQTVLVVAVLFAASALARGLRF